MDDRRHPTTRPESIGDIQKNFAESSANCTVAVSPFLTTLASIDSSDPAQSNDHYGVVATRDIKRRELPFTETPF